MPPQVVMICKFSGSGSWTIREKQACSKILDQVAEFCQLEIANAEEKKEITGLRFPVYNASKKRSIDSSRVQIGARNHDIVSGKLSKYMKSQNVAKPWGPRDFLRALVIIPIRLRAMSVVLNLY